MASKTTETIPKLITPWDMITLDTGSKVSAWVVFRPWKNPDEQRTPCKVLAFGRSVNTLLRKHLSAIPRDRRAVSLLVAEMLRARGMPTANEEFETCVQIGRFLQGWRPGPWSYAFRGDIKLCLCGSSRATDSNVRAALIELWGGEKRAMGGKKCSKCKGKGWSGAGRPTCPECKGKKWEIKPGPLNGMAEDEWAALAVAYWWIAEGKIQHHIPPPKTKKKKKGRGKARESAAVHGRKK